MNDHSHLPEPVPSHLQEQFALICGEFELTWHDKSTGRPRIEDFLDRVAAENRKRLVEILIGIEIRMRLSDGEQVESESYRTRFPDHDVGIIHAIELARREITVGSPESVSACDVSSVPERIGRYDVKKTIGMGGFGVVCLARDTQLNRDVALKFARKSRFDSGDELDTFIREAQTAAQLDHVGIVTVYDVLQQEDLICIVQKYVDGRDLKSELTLQQPSFLRTAEIIRDVALAIGVAHQKGFVHRDIKPANILIDAGGRPHVADFGLAIHESVQRRQRGERTGTPGYMSPELVLGETHRLDGRSDLWSVGIVMYEMLTRRRPFSGTTRAELFDEINNRNPRPPRQIDPGIPAELERVCLKLLSKRIVDRYTTAADLAEDLGHFLTRAEDDSRSGHSGTAVHSDRSPVADDTPNRTGDDVSTWESRRQPGIVPKGLRSFDDDDADFFLQLLPGPRDRKGSPEGMRFWLHFTRQTAAGKAESVGLIYGPSGCGKSSFVKAGLMPRLDDSIVPVYVEATKDETEARLQTALISRIPGASRDYSLSRTLDAIREGMWLPSDRKLLLVIDQFEQWLHDRTVHEMLELARALRQCDGRRIQCILLVRDDFWLATSRFLRELEVDLREGQNAMLVDLFDTVHARRVLIQFGQAYGRLPEKISDITREHEEFLDRAIEGLAEDDKIICVRLALFAEMFKGKPWVPAELSRIGGTEGVGFAFLEDTFSSKTARPEFRMHESAARQVLEALLPDSGTDIRGEMRPVSQLRDISGYSGKPQAFNDLIRILDKQLRLITLTDPEGIRDEESVRDIDTNQACYQLTHDFLVGSLRSWLTRKKKITMRGRAELRLAEQAEMWTSKPDPRYLPSLWGYLNIRSLTRKSSWTPNQSRMMQKAFRQHAARIGVVALLLVLVGIAGSYLLARNSSHALVARLFEAELGDVPAVIDEMQPLRSHIDPLLDEELHQREDSPRDQLRIRLAQHAGGQRQTDYLFARTLECNTDEFAVLLSALDQQKPQLVENAWSVLDADTGDRQQLIRAAAVVASCAPDDTRWNHAVDQVADALVELDVFQTALWQRPLSPVSHRLLNIFATRMANSDNDGAKLIQLYRHYSQDIVAPQTPLLERYSKIDLSRAESAQELTSLARQKANLASALFGIGHFDAVSSLLDFNADLTATSLLVDRIVRFQLPPELIWSQLRKATDPIIRGKLMLCLADLEPERFPFRDRLLEFVTRVYREDPDAYVHSCSELLLRKLTEKSLLQVRELCADHVLPDAKWKHINRHLNMVHLEGPGTFRVSGRDEDSPLDYAFEISSTEITIDQFREYLPDFQFPQPEASLQRWNQDFYDRRKQTDDAAMSEVFTQQFAFFCNWLSEQHGLPESEWCFVPQSTVKVSIVINGNEPERIYALVLAPDYLNRRGFRFPTEVEWEFACQAHDENSFVCGVDADLVTQYARYKRNNAGVYLPQSVGQLKPNRFGLFDIQGNASEFCLLLEHENPEVMFVEKGGSVWGELNSLIPYRQQPVRITGTLDMTAGIRVVRIANPVGTSD
ncbi:MAG: protein kinase domain-containing protein [Pirellulaceae bacterium]